MKDRNSVYEICRRIRAVGPARRRMTGRCSQPLVSLELYDYALTWAKMSALKSDLKWTVYTFKR